LKPRILIITGLSGSGKTIALRALEDIGYYCVDNLPSQLIDNFASTITEKGAIQKIAISMDIREKESLPIVVSDLQPLRTKYEISIIFFEADKDTLLRRFKETRRPHPLMSTKMHDLDEAISIEKGLILPLREAADRIIDTSGFTPHQLRQYMISNYGAEQAMSTMNVTIMSFGFKFGVPQNADLVFDVRFLPNPHFVPELKELDGKNSSVKEFVLEKEQTEEFIKKLKGMMDFLIPLYVKEGKTYLTIGIGCTGGRHRSIVVAEEIASLIKLDNLNISVIHRDM
jgi:UPF0042 nucleotide-binding protein